LDLINIYKDQLFVYTNFKESKDTLKLQKDLGALYAKYLGPWGPDGCFVWSEKEFIEFNEANMFNHYHSIKKRALHLIENDIDSILSRIFIKVSEYSGYSIEGTYYIYFMPKEMQGFDMGGCDINTMQINLNNENLTIDGIAKTFPHELNHQIFELSSTEDKHYGTVLWGIIDEGFATYFEKNFNNTSLLYSLNFTDLDFEWCLTNEKYIYQEAKLLFLSTDMEDEQRLRGNQGKYLIKGAPSRLNYFLGYRIIEQYVKVNGKSSWKDVYTTSVMELLVKSHYEKFLDNGLNH